MHDLRDLMIDLTTQTDGATTSADLLAQCRGISADYGGPPALEASPAARPARMEFA